MGSVHLLCAFVRERVFTLPLLIIHYSGQTMLQKSLQRKIDGGTSFQKSRLSMIQLFQRQIRLRVSYFPVYSKHFSHIVARVTVYLSPTCFPPTLNLMIVNPCLSLDFSLQHGRARGLRPM